MEPEDAEALRRRLYRPGASTTDLDVYLRATEPEREDAAPGTSRPPVPTPGRRRPFVIGGAVVGAVALLGGVLLTSRPAPPAAAPSTVTTPEQDGTSTSTSSPNGILDGGPIPHAEGSATQEGSQMYRYVVTSGDTVPAIADRFDLCQADVLDALPYGADPGDLAVGQGLELSRSESNEC